MRRRTAALLAAVFLLGGCATNNPKDPFEHFNRAVFGFNDTVDQAAIKPAAEIYRGAIPSVVQTGIGNFFSNLGDVWTGANNVLQGKIGDGVSDIMRFSINSVFGFGGVIDVASEAGLPKNYEDFGQTLGWWGVPAGPYIVVPFFGPSTLRDTVAWPADIQGNPWRQVESEFTRYFGSTLRYLDQRAAALDATNLIEEAALDRYGFVRDGYLQRRQGKVYDGNPPRQKFPEDARDEPR